jgi:hypothetical protein
MPCTVVIEGGDCLPKTIDSALICEPQRPLGQCGAQVHPFDQRIMVMRNLHGNGRDATACHMSVTCTILFELNGLA